MKKILLSIFMALTVGATACEFDDMTHYFTSEGIVEVQDNILYINNLAWWNRLRLEQKEGITKIFRTVSINHDLIHINEVRDVYSGKLLAEFKVWDNEIKVVN